MGSTGRHKIAQRDARKRRAEKQRTKKGEHWVNSELWPSQVKKRERDEQLRTQRMLRGRRSR